jgi:hypothetical protein
MPVALIIRQAEKSLCDAAVADAPEVDELLEALLHAASTRVATVTPTAAAN